MSTVNKYERPDWWFDIMEYIRTVSGTVYEDQIKDLIKKHAANISSQDVALSQTDVTEFLNRFTDDHCGEYDYKFLKIDERTAGIYTIPGARYILDRILWKHNPDYLYNEYLYTEDSPEKELIDSAYSIEDILDSTYQVVGFNNESRLISIDLTKLPRKNGCKQVVVNSFDIQKIIDEYFKRHKEYEKKNIRIGFFNAPSIVFTGETKLSFEIKYSGTPIFTEGACFRESTFCGRFLMQNAVFMFSDENEYEYSSNDYNSCSLDFRNARFYDAANFNDVKFTGSAMDMLLSFEDTRFSTELTFTNIDFGRISINCFQTIFGRYYSNEAYDFEIKPTKNNDFLFRILHGNFEDGSRLEFRDVEMLQGDVIFQDIPNFPSANLSFIPLPQNKYRSKPICPNIYMLIRSCEIHQTLMIGNVSKLSFLDTNNYSKIVSTSNWASVSTESTYFQQKYRYYSKGLGGTKIINKLLLAVYNNDRVDCFKTAVNVENKLGLAKANDFIMLKENFNEIGIYDDEDTAFILYMEYKPILDSVLHGKEPENATPWRITQFLYKILYGCGKYGISPIRVISALLVVMLSFTLFIYIPSVLLKGIDSFSLSNTMNGSWNYGNLSVASSINSVSLWDKITISFVYSLENIIPFVSQFEPVSLFICIMTAVENCIGSFLIGYFSVAVVRKTLR